MEWLTFLLVLELVTNVYRIGNVSEMLSMEDKVLDFTSLIRTV